jgi:AraC family chitin signaling transcriptional activator
MSETSIKQLFRRHFDTTPMAYYEQLRMSDARRRLRQPGSSVTSVACEMGFSSPAYFSTRFRHVTGMTPREFLQENDSL